MSSAAPATLRPLADAEPSPTPWRLDDLGQVFAADGHRVCRISRPLKPLTARDNANGTLIVAAPALLEQVRETMRWLTVERDDLLRDYCTRHPVTGAPDRTSMDDDEAAHIADIEAKLAALAAAAGIA